MWVYSSPSSVPELDEVIVATGRELPAIGTDDDIANPALMRIDDALGLRRGSVSRPDEHLAVVIGGEQLAANEGEPAHPAAMPGERDLGLIRELPALDAVILSAGKDESPRRIESAREQRAIVPQLQRHAGACGRDGAIG